MDRHLDPSPAAPRDQLRSPIPGPPAAAAGASPPPPPARREPTAVTGETPASGLDACDRGLACWRRAVAARWPVLALPVLLLSPGLATGSARAVELGSGGPVLSREGTGPGRAGSEAAEPPRETIFVLDLSGAADGPAPHPAKAALLRALDRLRPGDSFNVLAAGLGAAGGTRALFPGSWPARPELIGQARRWVVALETGGGGGLRAALETALGGRPEGYGRSGERAVRQVIVLSGGTVEGTLGGAAAGTAGGGARTAGNSGAVARGPLWLAAVLTLGVPGLLAAAPAWSRAARRRRPAALAPEVAGG